MSKKSELEDQVARLTALVEEMRARMSGFESAGRPARIEVPRSRRDILRMGGAAALGAVGAAALRAVPAAATDGSAVLAGQNNTSTLPTKVTGAAAPAEILGAVQLNFDSAAFTATGESFSGPLQGLGGVSWDGVASPATPFSEGVDGFATGPTAYGVYGLTDSGTGVTGESSTGTSVYARGSGRVRQDPHALKAATYWPGSVPDYAANAVEQVRDAAGTLWLSNAAGKWRRASTFEVFPNPRRVYGNGVALAAGTTVADVNATKKLDGSSSGVPAGVVAAWCAVQSFEPAVLSIYPAGSPNPGVGTFGVMGTAGISIQIVYMMVPLNALGHFAFKNMKTTARIFFDVWGYLSQSV